MPRFYGQIIVPLAWLLWLIPFVVTKRASSKPNAVDQRGRWGMLFQMAGAGLMWSRAGFSPQVWRVALSLVFLLAGIALSWAAPRALGKHWRIEAALSPDHDLVTSGPYGIVRNPIYTALLCMMLGTGFMLTPLPRLLLAFVLAAIGTEIRVRIEEGMLAARFGEKFREYRRTVPAYIPFLR